MNNAINEIQGEISKWIRLIEEKTKWDNANKKRLYCKLEKRN